jgi:putative adhesin
MKLSSLILIFFLMTVCLAYGDSYEFQYYKTVTIEDDPELTIYNSIGHVTVLGSPTDGVTIEAVKIIRAGDSDEAERLAEFVEIKPKKNGRRLTVETMIHDVEDQSRSFWQKLFGSGRDMFGSVDFVITVPLGCKVFVENRSGNIEVSGVTEAVTIVGGSGNITLASINAAVSIESISGKIEMSEIKGDVSIASGGADIEMTSVTGIIDIRSASGTTVGTYIDGPVKISKTSGHVKIKELNGDIRIKSTSGNIDIVQLDGAIDIQTNAGNVKVSTELFSERGYFVETAVGEIVFRVPETSSGTVNLETLSGSINTELPLTIRTFSKSKLMGDFGGRGPKISLISESGDITLEQY